MLVQHRFEHETEKRIHMTNLVREIQYHLDRLEWSQRDLATRAGISSATISKLMRGVHNPTPATLDAIARALGIEPTHLLQLAGLPVITEAYDLEAAYIARKITELPNEVRKRAVDIIGTQLDSIYELIGNTPPSPHPDEARPLGRIPPPEEIKDRLVSGDIDIKQLRQDLFLALKVLSQEAPDMFLEIMDELESKPGDELDD